MLDSIEFEVAAIEFLRQPRVLVDRRVGQLLLQLAVLGDQLIDRIQHAIIRGG